jgi:hypothetical protein
MNNNVAVLVLENDNQKLITFDLTFKSTAGIYKSAKNVATFLEYLFSRKWDYIFLTHDLDPESISSESPNSGYQALVSINEQYPLKEEIQKIFITSTNPAGVKNMVDYAYVNNMDNVIVAPFGQSVFKGEIAQITKSIRQSNAY